MTDRPYKIFKSLSDYSYSNVQQTDNMTFSGHYQIMHIAMGDE